MRNYFIHENGQQTGPFTIDELKSKGITSQTPIWTDGMGQWLEAGKIEELKAILAKTPPTYNTNSYGNTQPPEMHSAFKEATEDNNENKGRKLRLAGLLLLICLLLGYIIYEKNKPNPCTSYTASASYTPPIQREKTAEELRSELKRIEQLDPNKYLRASLTDHRRFFNTRIIEFDITNSATLANFKDATLVVAFHSKTKTVIDRRRYSVFEYFAARKTTNHTIKVDQPSGTVHVDISIESATPVN
jgi:hypothetical protein